jgi:hypothetical protein
MVAHPAIVAGGDHRPSHSLIPSARNQGGLLKELFIYLLDV